MCADHACGRNVAVEGGERDTKAVRNGRDPDIWVGQHRLGVSLASVPLIAPHSRQRACVLHRNAPPKAREMLNSTYSTVTPCLATASPMRRNAGSVT